MMEGRDQLRKAKQVANVQLGTYVRPSMPNRRHAVSQPATKDQGNRIRKNKRALEITFCDSSVV